MIELDNRAEQFLASIRAEGEESCAAVRRATNEQIDAQLKKTRAAERARGEQTLQFEKARMVAAANRTLSTARTAARAKLAAQRETLVAGVFADAEHQLVEFSSGRDYPKWLTEKANAMARRLGSGATLSVRPVDLPLLKGALPAGCTLTADESIRLGGVRGKGHSLAADDTLESRLAAQKDWFLQNSDLAISL